jgi:ribonuclease HI
VSISLKAYTDGSYNPQNGCGGWAAVIYDSDGEVIRSLWGKAGNPESSVNRMEMAGVIETIDAVTKAQMVKPLRAPSSLHGCKSLTIVSDSKYLINGAMGISQLDSNADLWAILYELRDEARKAGITIGWMKVEAHTGVTGNEEADKLARAQYEAEAKEQGKQTREYNGRRVHKAGKSFGTNYTAMIAWARENPGGFVDAKEGTAHAVLIDGKWQRFKPNGATGTCPNGNHGSRRPNFWLAVNERGYIIARCAGDTQNSQSGCDRDEIFEKFAELGIGTGRADLQIGTLVCSYQYRDEQGRVVFCVNRYRNPKGFRTADANGKVMRGVMQPLLYRLPELIAAPDGCLIHICEGEKDVDNAIRCKGWVATTNPGMHSRWDDSYNKYLRHHEVVIWADNDDRGRARARSIEASLRRTNRVRVVWEIPNGCKDLTDYLKSEGCNVTDY